MKMELFKFTGFFLALVLFSLLFFSVLTHSIEKNISIILSFFFLNLLLAIILPKILPKKRTVVDIKKGFEIFGKAVNKVVVSIVLFFVYFFGVGIVWFLARITGKKFLRIKFIEKSTWKKIKNKKYDFEEMF